MPSLSVVTFTHHPPDRVAAALLAIRPIAAEVVVAVDDRLADDDLTALSDVADRVVLAPWHGAIEHELAWLHAACSGEWVLRLDGDEVASDALVNRLAEPGWDVDRTHLLVPRLWVWPDPSSALDEQPWRPDLQLRLVRNQPGIARFGSRAPGSMESPVDVAGWAGVLDEPILHLALLDADLAGREAEARRAERRHPGRRLPGGYSLPVGLLVPERSGRQLATTPLGPVDRERVEALLTQRWRAEVTRTRDDGAADGTTVHDEAPGPPGRTSAARTGVGTVERIRDRPVAPPVPADGSVAVAGPLPGEWVAGREVELAVRVSNTSTRAWRPDHEPPVRVGIRFRRGEQAVGHEARIELPGPLAPGQTTTAVGRAPVPGEPGHHHLDVDLVLEHVGWFGSGVTVDVEVRPARRIALTGGFSPYRHLGDDLIIDAVLAALAFELPEHDIVVLADDPAGATARYGPPAVQGANPLLHRSRPANTALALRRVAALRRDAARVAKGEVAHDPMHGPLLDALAASSVLVAPGAGWFTSKYRIEQVLPRLAEVEAARALGLPVLFESGTVGPFDSRTDRALARRLIAGLDRLTVRDGDRSETLARSLGAREVLQVPDAATAAEPDEGPARDRWLSDRGIDPTGPYAIVSVRDTGDPTAVGDSDATVDTLVAALRVVAEAAIPALFLPHCTAPETDDRPAGRAISDRVPLVVDDLMPPDDVAVALIHGAAVTVGNRFHLALVADAGGTPGLFLASTPFDAVRSGAFTGGNVEVVGAEPGGVAGAEAARRALTRGRGAPADRWDGHAFAQAVLAAIAPRTSA